MNRYVCRSPYALIFILAAPLALAACDQSPTTAGPANAPDNIEIMANMSGVPVSAHAIGNGAVPTPVDPPVPAQSDAMKGEAGARMIIADWAHALERRDWAKARAQWGHGGSDSGLDPAAFAASYDKYATIAVSLGDGTGDAGAGSLYYEVPVRMTGTLKDGGGPFTLEGPVTLRRVNDVDGASPADLRWHISQSGLKPRP